MVDIEVLLPFVPVVVALAIGFAVSSHIRRSMPVEPAGSDPIVEPAYVEPSGELRRVGLMRRRAAPPDASGANRVALDEEP